MREIIGFIIGWIIRGAIAIIRLGYLIKTNRIIMNDWKD